MFYQGTEANSSCLEVACWVMLYIYGCTRYKSEGENDNNKRHITFGSSLIVSYFLFLENMHLVLKGDLLAYCSSII